MEPWTSFTWAAAALGAFAMSAFVTWGSIAYARRHGLVDLPGQRRSHASPTPRGGGIGIVAAVLAGNVALFLASAQDNSILMLSAAILCVAAVGWIDDHRGLGARFRFAAHCLAALLVLGWAPIHWAAVGIDLPSGVQLLRIGAFAIAMLAIVWSINLHNFMDGIDGLLAMQALFVFVVLALLCAGAGQFAEAGRIALFAAATLGFLPFNFPRARIFMGDVGSGVLGLLVIVAVGWQMNATSLAWSSGLIACSAFVADATATLLSRILRGRRWYSAHREHLYQWLVRGGRSHVRVVVYYAGWNLLLVVPVLCWINRAQATSGSADGIFSSRDIEAFGAAVVVYAIALLVWFLGKRHCLKMARHRTRDAGA